jgi:hypothetical protein
VIDREIIECVCEVFAAIIVNRKRGMGARPTIRSSATLADTVSGRRSVAVKAECSCDAGVPLALTDDFWVRSRASSRPVWTVDIALVKSWSQGDKC